MRWHSSPDGSGTPATRRTSATRGISVSIHPAEPRDDKTLCDDAGIFTKSEAQRLLREGVQRGLISEQARGEFPQNVWAVTEDGCPLEAELENKTQGTYHGYPVLGNDPFRERILERWNQQ